MLNKLLFILSLPYYDYNIKNINLDKDNKK